MNGADKTCLLHGPGNFSEECKVLKDYSKKYAAKRPHKYTESRYVGKKNVIRLSILTAESSNTTSHNMMLLPPRKRRKN